MSSVENVVKLSTRLDSTRWSTLKAKKKVISSGLKLKLEKKWVCVQAASEGIKRNICEKLKRLRCVWRAFNLLNLSSIYFSVCRYFLWSVWFHSIKLVRLSLTWEVGYEEKLMKFYKSCLSNDLDCGWRLSIGNISICIRGIIHVEILKFNFKLHV